MVATASITGIIKTLLIIGGSYLFLRFIGQLMIAKRNIEEERSINANQRKFEKERQEKLKRYGKTTILRKDTSSIKTKESYSDVVDVDFEDLS